VDILEQLATSNPLTATSVSLNGSPKAARFLIPLLLSQFLDAFPAPFDVGRE
jgi:hypothetical protein